MLPDRVSNPGPLTYGSGALPIALRDPACKSSKSHQCFKFCMQVNVTCDPFAQSSNISGLECPCVLVFVFHIITRFSVASCICFASCYMEKLCI